MMQNARAQWQTTLQRFVFHESPAILRHISIRCNARTDA
jgi:hypothetical protein